MSITVAMMKRNCFSIISLPLAVLAFMFSPIFIGPIAIASAFGSYIHKENKVLIVVAFIWTILLTCIGIFLCTPGLLVSLSGD